VLQTWAGEQIVMAFRTRLFAHAQRLSLAYHDSKGTSDSTFRIQYDAPALQYVMVNGLIPLISSISLLAGMIWVTFRLDWELALVALAVSPVLFILIRRFSRRLRKGWQDVSSLESSAHAMMNEVLSSLRVVKAFAQEEHEHSRFQQKSRGLMKEHVRVSMIQGFFDFAIVATIAAGTATTLYVGVLHVQAGLLTLGG
jgi:ATP-binding cassette subfamily B protein